MIQPPTAQKRKAITRIRIKLDDRMIRRTDAEEDYCYANAGASELSKESLAPAVEWPALAKVSVVEFLCLSRFVLLDGMA